MKKNIVIILAAGTGSRSGFDEPKQLVKLGGIPVITYSIQQFQNNDHICEILIVTNNECLERIETIISDNGFFKVRGCILGGNERHESSLAAIQAYSEIFKNEEFNIIFHDAVRPLISTNVINQVVLALDNYNAVDVVVPVTDTMVKGNLETNTIVALPDRNSMFHGQTPQGFSFQSLKKAYDFAVKDPDFLPTDNCGVILKYMPNEPIYYCVGDRINIKLTYKEDLFILEKLLQIQSINNGVGFELQSLSKLREKVIIVIGGSSGIGKEIVSVAEAYLAKVYPLSRSNGIDIQNNETLFHALNEISKMHGGIDYIVNTASILTKKALINCNQAEINEIIYTNYIGAVNVAKLAYPHLKKKSGHLLFFTSSSYTRGRANYALYSSTKAAIVNLTQALSDEWSTANIRVSCIDPERTNTPMRTKAFGLEDKNTLLSPREVAKKSLFVLINHTSGLVHDIKKTN